ncbi:MAG: c-type cytochrome biogenesis protein CcmI [Rhodanobacteraceae bacterium]
MTFLFLGFAALMVAVALILLLTPLLRRRGSGAHDNTARLRALDAALAAGIIDADEYRAKRDIISHASDAAAVAAARPRRPVTAAVAVALLLPAAALILYRLLGAPQALHEQASQAPVESAVATDGTAPPDHGADMQKAITGLVAKLKQHPDDIAGWSLLGRAYQNTQRFEDARDAFKHALGLEPDNVDMKLEYAQAMALATPEHKLSGEPRKLIESALATDPNNQRGLWLLGIGDYQEGNYQAAIASWNKLLPQLQPGSDLAKSVSEQIADAQTKLGNGGAAPAAASADNVATPDGPMAAAPDTDAGASASPAPKLTVAVALDPKLKDKFDPDATLFVFAKAASGPPMPLAIQRMSASKLPITITLDDSMGMLPSLRLSMFPQVVIGARVSKSGNALPQSGDLQVLSAPIDVHRTTPIALTIDQQVR